MDQDEDLQMCVAPAASDAAAPATGDESPAAVSAAPAAGNADNPLLSSLPAVQAPPEALKSAADTADTVGKVVDFAGTMSKAAGGAEAIEKAGGEVGGLMSAAGDTIATANGVREMQNGDMQNGVIDTAIGASGVVGDVASAFGGSSVANPANAVKGGLEIGKGAGQLIDAATSDDPAPGQSGKDTATETVNGVENVLKGAADGASAMPNPWVAGAGKALGAGMAVGNAIAPAVFGDMNESTGDMGMTSDGVYHGTTGNSVIDWVAGVGKYSNSRWGDDSAPQK